MMPGLKLQHTFGSHLCYSANPKVQSSLHHLITLALHDCGDAGSHALAAVLSSALSTVCQRLNN